MATIVGKLFYIHIVKNDYYENLVDNQFHKSKVIQGNRGYIFDRNGKYIAKNKTAFSFLVDTNQNYDKEKILNKLSKYFSPQVTILNRQPWFPNFFFSF